MRFPADKLLRVGVLSNPKSGGNRKGLGAVRDILSPHPDAFHRTIQNLADTVAALDEFSRKALLVMPLAQLSVPESIHQYRKYPLSIGGEYNQQIA